MSCFQGIGFVVLLIACTQELQASDFPYLSCFKIASQQSGVPMDLLMAVAMVESNADADARSNANAHGVMQIRWPLTARHLGAGRVAELYNPCLNISMGADYLKELSGRYAGNDVLVLAAYNYGPSRINVKNDIPASVLVYVQRVEQQRAKITKDMTEKMPAALKTAREIEIIRFGSAFRAKQYLLFLNKQVPDAELRIRKTGTREFVVVLDASNLSTEARYRLVNLIPDMQG